MIWKTSQIQSHLSDIKDLFQKTYGHKHTSNYISKPLFEHTVFARMAWDAGGMIYYSAGIERPEYNGSIRIMSRHTRDRDYDFGGYKADLIRGTETLDVLVNEAHNNGYEDIWVSREESPQLLEYFSKASSYDWMPVVLETLHYGGQQYVLRLK